MEYWPLKYQLISKLLTPDDEKMDCERLAICLENEISDLHLEGEVIEFGVLVVRKDATEFGDRGGDDGSDFGLFRFLNIKVVEPRSLMLADNDSKILPENTQKQKKSTWRITKMAQQREKIVSA